MVSVSTAELKAHLSKYLRMVKNGLTVEVTSHRHSVAHLVPSNSEDQPRLIEPVRPLSDVQHVEGLKTKRSIDGVTELLRDRSRR